MDSWLFLSPPRMSGREVEEVARVFASSYVAPAGLALAAFEDAFKTCTGFRHGVALASGSGATHLALRHLGVGSATRSGPRASPSSAPSLRRRTSARRLSSSTAMKIPGRSIPAFSATGSLPPLAAGGCLEPSSRPISTANPAISTSLSKSARYEVPVICDSAEAMGTLHKCRHAGRGAWCAVFSFNGNKVITTTGDRMLASEDAGLIEHARKLSQQAREPAAHYEHVEIGYNYRLSNVLAAIGVGQLSALEVRVARRRGIFSRYRDRLGSARRQLHARSRLRSAQSLADRAAHRSDGLWSHREEVRLALEGRNIESRPIWKPMHMQPVFKDAPRVGGAVSERLFEIGLCMPSGSAMSDEDVDRVCEIFASRF